MSHFYRLIPRATTNIFYVSRMNAHNLPPGSSVKVPEAKSGQHIVSGSGQFIATDGSSSTRTGIGGGSSASMLPGAQTLHDKTNPTKTTGDAKQSHSKGGPDKAHQSIFKSPAGQFGLVAVALISIYGAYKMLLGHSPDQKANFRDKEARITRPDLHGESDVHAKLAEEHHPKKPRETVNPSTTTKAH